jgi:type IV pilus assembly protein PilQ
MAAGPMVLRSAMRALVLSAALCLFAVHPAPAAPPDADGEARVSVDFKDADIRDVVLLMAEVGRFQVVVDQGVTCRLTLKLKDVPWDTALDVALRSCGLGYDAENGIYRVAPTARLAAELAERRRFEEERRLNRPLRTVRYRLSYARAAELAPLIKKFLSPRGDVVYDTRTNTLYITDID